jgi:geranylgeranyl diphosphate synthase, type I
MKTASKKDQADMAAFKDKLAAYRQLIDGDINSYSRHVRNSTLQQFGKNARLEIDAYLDVLERGGKRIRGALVILGYEMLGGKDTAMILQAARAIEMLHAYILIIDDIQDRSLTRRGGAAAHAALAEYHRKHQLAGEPDHFGISIALNGAIAGAHAAQVVLANLDAPDDLRLKAISIVNRTMLVTAHGQTNDILNEVVASVSEAEVERVLEWKTAHYTFLNPLHVGMVLAAADCHATDAVTDYAMHAGKAFQITDDILGIFGNEFESGKSPMDDIREGKRTILTVRALDRAGNGNKNFLISMLGNSKLSPVEFERCKDIITETGALDYARDHAERHVAAAVASLEKFDPEWSKECVAFLRRLANYLLLRQS